MCVFFFSFAEKCELATTVVRFFSSCFFFLLLFVVSCFRKDASFSSMPSVLFCSIWFGFLAETVDNRSVGAPRGQEDAALALH